VRNPFTPSFGSSPPLLVGRDDVIEQFSEAIDDGPGSPGRATLYTGSRGVGKTVLLNAVEERARSFGWLVITETATPGLVRRLVEEHLPSLLRDQDDDGTRRRLTGLNAPSGLGGASWETRDSHPVSAGLRNQICDLTDLLARHETGLLITVDEIPRRQTDDLRQLAAVVQHAFREDRDLAFVGAGLPSAISDLLNDDVLTFLRRADRHVLGPVDVLEVAQAIREPIETSGRTISVDACRVAADATGGYPFLIQLIGHNIWRQQPKERSISKEDVYKGVAAARHRMGSLVHEPALVDASHVDRSFLVAMAVDDGPSHMHDIANRLGVSAGYAGQYRRRLIEAQLIESTAYGEIDFAVPYMRDYLRDQAAGLSVPAE